MRLFLKKGCLTFLLNTELLLFLVVSFSFLCRQPSSVIRAGSYATYMECGGVRARLDRFVGLYLPRIVGGVYAAAFVAGI